MFRDSEPVLQTMSPETRIEKNWILWIFEAISCKRTIIAAEIFVSKTTPFKVLSKRTNKFSKVRLLAKKYPGKRNIVSDCKSIGRNEPSFNILFLAKNIVDPCEIYMDGICKWSLTIGLRFIGYIGIGEFLPFFKNLHFIDFHSKKCSFKANASHEKFYLFWRKQIMSINQASDRLYSVKVSKFWFLGRFPTLLDPYWQRLLIALTSQILSHNDSCKTIITATEFLLPAKVHSMMLWKWSLSSLSRWAESSVRTF